MVPGSTPSPYPSPGEIIDGKYQLERVLGEGGMGCVARAYHLLLRAPVALKFMNPQFMTFPGAVERFLQEGRASKKIRSDHVVPVEDVGKLSSGAPYLVMPCLEGMDLADLLARDGTPGLPITRANPEATCDTYTTAISGKRQLFVADDASQLLKNVRAGIAQAVCDFAFVFADPAADERANAKAAEAACQMTKRFITGK